MPFGSQIETQGSLQEKNVSYDFWLKTLRDSNVGATKDHGRKFRSTLTASFSGIVNWGSIYLPSKLLSYNIKLLKVNLIKQWYWFSETFEFALHFVSENYHKARVKRAKSEWK